MNNKLKLILKSLIQPQSRAFEFFVFFLIGVSIFSLCFYTHDAQEIGGNHIEAIVQAIAIFFLIEYGLRVMAPPNKRNYMISFFGVIDLLALLSLVFFFLCTFFSLRIEDMIKSMPFINDSSLRTEDVIKSIPFINSLRILRIFSILRILKLGQLEGTMVRFGRAVSHSKNEFLLLVVFMGILLFLAATGIHIFEHEKKEFSSIFSSFWWAISALTKHSVNIVPETPGGRMFGSLIMVVTVGMVAIPAGLIATALIKAHQEEKT